MVGSIIFLCYVVNNMTRLKKYIGTCTIKRFYSLLTRSLYKPTVTHVHHLFLLTKHVYRCPLPFPTKVDTNEKNNPNLLN